MRGYSVGTATLALAVDPKWLDNLLSQNLVYGATRARQGIPRTLTPSALYRIDTVRALNRDLQIPIRVALRLAHELWNRSPNPADGDTAAVQVGSVSVQLDRREVRTRVDAALAEALEMAPRPHRGRPRQKKSLATGLRVDPGESYGESK